ncbi:hypothetical protein BLA29_015217, partial [Euroglyphus maynei]
MEVFKEKRKLIEMASKMSKPANDGQFMQLLQPISKLVTQIQANMNRDNKKNHKFQEIKEQNRKHEHFNHLSAIAEGI